MISMRRTGVAAAIGATLLAMTAAGGAAATPRGAGAGTPQTVTGSMIKGGADGSEQKLMCPDEESVLSGGFAISADPGDELGATPADILESRPTADATGWIIAVRKFIKPEKQEHPEAANLTLYLVCTQGENTPGG